MKEKLVKLMDVKSIVTFLLSGVFAVLALRGEIAEREFMTVFTMVISFYFGTQHEKRAYDPRR